MQWNTIPRKLKRELFDRADSIGESRREKLMADALDDVWRFSCEMPDAPHLSKKVDKGGNFLRRGADTGREQI